ncbi:MAG: magnesium transporter [Candidatus Asgardarchaeia archaeon]
MASDEKRKIIFSIIRETTPAIILGDLTIEILAGLALANMYELYELIPGLLMIVPGLMSLRGNISSTLAQRIGSALHIGVISWDLGFNRELKENVKASIILSVIAAILLTMGASLITLIAGVRSIGFFGFLMITSMTIMVTTAIQLIITITLSMYVHKKGIDPDNVIIPLITTMNDVIVVYVLFFVAKFVIVFYKI